MRELDEYLHMPLTAVIHPCDHEVSISCLSVIWESHANHIILRADGQLKEEPPVSYKES